MKSIRQHSAALLQRTSQAVFLGLFLALTCTAGSELLPSNLFVRFDPLVAVLSPLLNRAWLPQLLPGLAVVALTFLVGRVFCGYVCPLGTTLDVARAVLKNLILLPRRLLGNKQTPQSANPAGNGGSGPGHASAPTDEDNEIITRGWLQLKYIALMVVTITALLGVNTIVWGSPLALATRFYALLLEPLLRIVGGWALDLAPALAGLGLDAGSVSPRVYAGFTFLLILFGLMFVMELIKPRFWCRYVCPAGALLGLCAGVAPWRRRVKKCVPQCGLCAVKCPTATISPDGLITAQRECIVCRACAPVCPEQGICFTTNKQGELAPLPDKSAAPDEAKDVQTRVERTLAEILEAEQTEREEASQSRASGKTGSGAFGLAGARGDRRRRLFGNENVRVERIKDINELTVEERPFACTLPSRRAFIGAAAIGTLLGFVHFASAKRLMSRNTGPRARPTALLRPPGALPEMEFFSRCTRCGLCMKVCPSNGLQPAWSMAWIEDIFSPVLIPRRGPCEPGCNACGRVCPSGAIASLPLAAKQWAKIGTAEVQEARCLALAQGRPCEICRKACPFGAIDLVPAPSVDVLVPRVNAQKCFGCGYCEKHCPTAPPAILAKPDGALRLADGADYVATAKAKGLTLTLRAPKS